MNTLKKIDIVGFRGFQSKGTLELAQPNNTLGSGLTVITGANNAGKSIVIEALRVMQAPGADRSFPERSRNLSANSRIEISLHYGDRESQTLKTVSNGGSECEWVHVGSFTPTNVLSVMSRRAFQPNFNKTETDRNNYVYQLAAGGTRPLVQEGFAGRLFRIQRNRDAFNSVLSQVLSYVPNWYIEQGASGHYLRIETPNGFHDSEGLGDGITSLFVIADSLYDSKPGDLIAIDEPELSLHPAIQRRLAEVLAKYARDRQIVIATHSPYFLEPKLLENGMRVCRAHVSSLGTTLHELSTDTSHAIAKLTGDLNNPHTLGLNAREGFFLEDRILLFEGQEDVQLLPKLLEQIGVTLNVTPFGWGVGGADKMEIFAKMFMELGYKKLLGVLDRNKSALAAKLSSMFPEYRFLSLPADDIRTKSALNRREVYGLLDESYKLRLEFIDATKSLFAEAAKYLS